MEIPDKLFFKIGEAASLTKVKPFVLRYWESEFDILSPSKTNTGRRLYTKKDIHIICEIKHLLYNEKYSIKGAKRRLEQRATVTDHRDKITDLLKFIKKELQSIAASLKENNDPNS